MRVYIKILLMMTQQKELKVQYNGKFVDYWDVVFQFHEFLQTKDSDWVWEKNKREINPNILKAYIWTTHPNQQEVYDDMSFYRNPFAVEEYWTEGDKVFFHSEKEDTLSECVVVHEYPNGDVIRVDDASNSWAQYKYVTWMKKIAKPENPNYDKKTQAKLGIITWDEYYDSKKKTTSSGSYDPSGNEGFEYYYDV